MKITRQFSFAAAHHLTDYHGACERPHGHTYRLEVMVEGPMHKDGLVVDFVVLKKVVGEHVLDKLDHTDLNDIFENPSAEHIATWIFNILKKSEAQLGTEVKVLQVRLWEGDTTSVIYDGQ